MGEIHPENPELRILDGEVLADQIRDELKEEVADFEEEFGRPPGLAMIVLGNNRVALEYAEKAAIEANNIGMQYMSYLWPQETQDRELQFLIEELNSHTAFDGISIQAPLPPHISYEEMVAVIDPTKDVEGYHPLNVGRLFSNLDTMVPPPAAGGMELLLRYNIHPTGMQAVVIGRSRIIGKPMAGLLVLADATVSVCHSETPDISVYTRQADLIISCAGQGNLIKGDMVKPGVVVLDYGNVQDENGNLIGDVEWESVSKVASAITPTPGGTGPMTTMALLANTIKAARLNHYKS
jgi:methylenetetrahydrofolate dehydrogenase (NADP+)/methenyltetrahydrofolate cyclohydrolase